MLSIPIDICWVWNYASVENNSKSPGKEKVKNCKLKTIFTNHTGQVAIGGIYRPNE